MATTNQDTEENTLIRKKPPSRRKLILGVLLMSNLCAWSSTSLVAPFFPLEAAKKNVTDTVIGLVVSCSEFVIFLMSPVFGTLVSNYSPKFYYVAGLCLFGCCDVMFGCLNLSPPGDTYIAMCFAVRLVEAFGTTSLLTAGVAIAGNTFPDRFGTVYGALETVSGAGYVIGPIIGGILNEYGGYSLPFWMLGCCVFLCGCISWVVIPPQTGLKGNKKKVSALTLFKSPFVWFGANSIVACLFCFSVWSPVFAVHLTQFNLSQTVIGVIFALSSVPYSVGAPIWGHLFDRRNVPPIPSLIGGLCLAAVNMLFFGPAPFLTFIPTTEWLTIMTSVFIGIFLAPVIVGGMNCMVKGAGELGYGDDGSVLGLVGGICSSAGCLGSFLGPVLGGTLTEHVGFGWAMAISSLFLIQPVLCFSPLLVSLLHQRRKVHSTDRYSLL